jgi:2-dehydro-3-deoxy-D-arabinonate dehydratase
MKLLQFYLPQKGLRVGVLRDSKVIDITGLDQRIDSVLKLFAVTQQKQITASQFLTDFFVGKSPDRYDLKELNRPPDKMLPHLLIPIYAPEVWAFGVTYQRSAQARDDDASREKGIYDRVYNSARPECFFKATPSRCVGPNAPICIRSDSVLTATEPELAYILGENEQVLGYTICNDVSAWDLERENPLYLPQSKIYSGCCALGPYIVTPDELIDPMNLKITCCINRNNEAIYYDSTSSFLINRSFEELNHYLCLHNPVPFGSAVSTGTGIMVPNEYCLKDGDIVEIEIENIGRLINPVRQL